MSISVFLGVTLIFAGHAHGCGWAGENDYDEEIEVIEIGADGKPVQVAEAQPDLSGLQREIGNRYRSGIGVARNYEEAFKWYRSAAINGDAAAQNNLANMYERNLAGSGNLAEAYEWYLRSAMQGNPQAQHSLGHMYLTGRGVETDRRKGTGWILKSAQSSHVSAIKEIALLNWNGQGIEENPIEAFKWWKLSALNGDEEAETYLTNKQKEMTRPQIDAANRAFARAYIPTNKQTQAGLYLTAKGAYSLWSNHPNNYYILDVRTPEEYLFIGHASMANNIPIQFFTGRLRPDRKKALMKLNENFVPEVKKIYKSTDIILVICRSGVRSTLAVNTLTSAGYKHVYNIIDGFEGDMLEAAGNPAKGKRVVNGWRNSGAPWTYDIDPGLVYAGLNAEDIPTAE